MPVLIDATFVNTLFGLAALSASRIPESQNELLNNLKLKTY